MVGIKKNVAFFTNPFLVASLLSLVVHAMVIFSLSMNIFNPIMNLTSLLDAEKQDVLEVNLYNYRVQMEVLKKITPLQGLALVEKPAEGVEKKEKISISNPKKEKLLREIKNIFWSFWKKENIGAIGRSVVVFEVSKGEIKDFFIQEWEGTDIFFNRLLDFLKKLHSLQIPLTEEESIWFECEFSVEPTV